MRTDETEESCTRLPLALSGFKRSKTMELVRLPASEENFRHPSHSAALAYCVGRESHFSLTHMMKKLKSNTPLARISY